MTSIARQHTEWLSLVPVSGPFLSMPVLLKAFPQGLDKNKPEHSRLLRHEYGTWQESLEKSKTKTVPHHWIKVVLTQILELDERVLVEGQAIPQAMQVEVLEHHELLKPDLVVMDPNTKKPRLLVQAYRRDQDLSNYLAHSRWKASPDTRMAELLHGTDVKLGLVTNGEHWMLVYAPKGETTSYISWYASLWLEEPITLKAFCSLLSASRFFNVPDPQTLEALLAESAANQQDVTNQLGYQVRRAVEVLIHSLDNADQDRGRELLSEVKEEILYESALTVMMRLVFLFCAEERELIPSKPFPVYEQNYSVSMMSKQLRELADQHGEELLERRHDAWPRILVAFRAVYGGLQHDDVHIPAYGGNLFNPDRFPFLEGRKMGTSWRETEANPLPVNNRTVLHLLEALQLLQIKVKDGEPAEARRLSFRALDIEQIGHVYEGLLDHTAKRATETILGFSGTGGKESEIPLSELENLLVGKFSPQLEVIRQFTELYQTNPDKEFNELSEDLKDKINELEKALQECIKKGDPASIVTARHLLEELKKIKSYAGGASSKQKQAKKKSIKNEGPGFLASDDQLLTRLRTSCHQDENLWKRVKPFAKLLRLDSFGYPVVIPKGSVFVTAGTDRRSSGTHYTPRSLTEPIVQHTLEPLVYVGPAEGTPKEQWTLKPAKELLDLKICDMACGSGAFLVQAARYMSERLMEAWEIAKKENPNAPGITPEGKPSSGKPNELLIPEDATEQKTYAMRIIAQRCLYGVDKNPLAVEMAKLSLWLLTLAKDKPFEFLDHSIRCGDSLIGLHSLEKLEEFSKHTWKVWFNGIQEAILLRLKLEEMPANTVEDIERQEKLLKEANKKIARLRCAADLLISAEFWGKNANERAARIRHNAILLERYIDQEAIEEFEKIATRERNEQLMFHWPLEFPEVIIKKGGFDAFVGNPPFMGGKKITGNLSTNHRNYILEYLANGKKGNADLCAYFFLRAGQLVRVNGQFAFLSTNTIAQGDTREVGLDQLYNEGYVIFRAIPSQPWPGDANLEVAHIWIRSGEWKGTCFLNEQPTTGITPFLTPPGKILGNPYRLKTNENKSFQGSIVLGMGFVLTPQEAQNLIAKDPRNKDVLFPYLNGEDLNSQPDQSPSRWVINFFDWPIEKAANYPDCLQIVKEKVKPDRASKSKDVVTYPWWLHWRNRPELYNTIFSIKRVLVFAQTSKTKYPVFVKTDVIFDQKTVVITSESSSWFAVLCSHLHHYWVLAYGCSLRTDAVYTPSDCFETFPFPAQTKDLDTIGDRYYKHRQQIMLERQEGLTKTYNRFHNPGETSVDIQKLRELHVNMDQAVANAYGWSDLDLEHGFHETKQGVRYTISETARREVLQRLLKLNHERYEEEVKQGLHDKKKGSKGSKEKKKPPNTPKKKEPTLFDEEDEETEEIV